MVTVGAGCHWWRRRRRRCWVRGQGLDRHRVKRRGYDSCPGRANGSGGHQRCRGHGSVQCTAGCLCNRICVDVVVGGHHSPHNVCCRPCPSVQQVPIVHGQEALVLQLNNLHKLGFFGADNGRRGIIICGLHGRGLHVLVVCKPQGAVCGAGKQECAAVLTHRHTGPQLWVGHVCVCPCPTCHIQRIQPCSNARYVCI